MTPDYHSVVFPVVIPVGGNVSLLLKKINGIYLGASPESYIESELRRMNPKILLRHSGKRLIKLIPWFIQLFSYYELCKILKP